MRKSINADTYNYYEVNEKNQLIQVVKVCENITFDKLLNDSIDFRQTDGNKVSTIKGYITDMTIFKKYVDDLKLSENLERLTEKHIRKYMKNLMDAGYKNTTINKYMKSVKYFFNCAVINKELFYNPTSGIKSLKQQQEIYRYLSLDEINTLLESINVSTAQSYRNFIILLTHLDIGCRVSELVSINIEQVDFQRQCINFEIQKTYEVHRRPVSKLLISNLKVYIKNVHKDKKNGPLFNGFDMQKYKLTKARIKTSNVRAIYRSIGIKIGLDFTLTTHMIRRTVITQHILNGGDLASISKLVGHKDIRSTMRYVNYKVEDLNLKHEQFGIFALLIKGSDDNEQGSSSDEKSYYGVFKR